MERVRDAGRESAGQCQHIVDSSSGHGYSRRVDLAGEALVARRVGVGESERRVIEAIEDPVVAVVAYVAAVERVDAILVERGVVRLAVELKGAVLDAVGVASDDWAKVVVRLRQRGDGVSALDDVTNVSRW